jgi:hypothetical protein
LEITCDISILTPINKITRTVENQVILVENVLMGDVPETYYNIQGLDVQEDILDTTN